METDTTVCSERDSGLFSKYYYKMLKAVSKDPGGEHHLGYRFYYYEFSHER